MATRSKKPAAPRKRAPKKRAEELAEEAANVGADIIPEGTIEVSASGNRQPATTSLLSDTDLHLFNEGTHRTLWEKLGSHIVPGGVIFDVWAPNAERVSVIGDFNAWDPQRNLLEARGASGLWEGFVPDIGKGTVYKYHIVSRAGGYRVDKADPYGI